MGEGTDPSVGKRVEGEHQAENGGLSADQQEILNLIMQEFSK